MGVRDPVPVHVALGSAHAYKFASVLRRIMAELALDGATPSAGDLAAFRINRPVLREASPVRSLIV